MWPYTVGKKPSVKADLAIYSQAVDVRGQCMSESLKLGHNLDFSSCDIMVGFHKSSHIYSYILILIKGIDSRKNGGKSKKPPVVSSGSY